MVRDHHFGVKLYRLCRLARLCGACLLLAAAVLPNESFGQDFRRYQPQTLPVPLIPPRVPAQPVDPPSGSDEILVDRWDAVLIVDSADKVRPLDDLAELEGVHFDVDDNSSLVFRSDFRNLVEKHLGGPVTLRALSALSREIIIFYRDRGRPVVDVAIPEQKITQGTIQIVVIEPRIGRVLVQGADWFNNQVLADELEWTQPGGRLFEGNLENDLFWLNRSPFRRVEVDLQPGVTPGTTDVIYNVRDAFPWRAYTGYEDTGVQALGIERLYAGFIWGDAFKRDGQFSYQYTTDTQFDRLQAHAYSYQRAFNQTWSFQQYGAMSTVSTFADPVNQSGRSWILGGALLRYTNYDPFLQSWFTFGFDFKSTNNNLEFGGTQVVGGRADFYELNLGYDRRRRFNNVSYLAMSSDLYAGPNGGLSAFNDAAGFSSIRSETRPGFVYQRGMTEGVIGLPFRMQVLGRVTGQISSQRLLFSEMLGYGGYDSIRGYDQRSFNADNGYFTNIEVGPQTWIWGTQGEPKSLRAFAFFDYGSGRVINPQPGDIVSETMASVGTGARFAWSDRFSARFDYGYGLSDVPTSSHEHRAHVGVVYVMGPRPRR
jgi:hemolysin activation/secretion protein